MKAIVPIEPIASRITSNVPITETVWAAGTYSLGDRRYVDTTLYEVIVASTSLSPSAGLLTDPPEWEVVSEINRFKMFDSIEGSQTAISSTGGSIEVAFDAAGTVITDVVLLNLEGSNVNIDVSVASVSIYNEDFSLQDFDEITDWYNFFFAEIIPQNDIVIGDVPNRSDTVVTVTVTNEYADDIAVGEMVVGRAFVLGDTLFDTSMSIFDFSQKTADENGNYSITEGRFIKEVSYNVGIPSNRVSAVYKFLQNYRAVPLVWVGEDSRLETVAYGFFRDFSIVLSNPAYSSCSLQVESL